jgi:hypothetical protein
MKPIDFIPNPIVDETWFITIEQVSTTVIYQSSYNKDDDIKWKQFCKKHNLNRSERHSQKWFDLYLELCALDIT